MKNAGIKPASTPATISSGEEIESLQIRVSTDILHYSTTQPLGVTLNRNHLKTTMPKLSLTDFVEIVSKAGTPKATKVRQIKNRPTYQPATDFYRPLRAGLSRFHQANRPRSCIDELLLEIRDPKKRHRYASALNGYAKWWGTKKTQWFDPERGSYTSSGMELSVNPELGLSFNGKKHLVKLYFKDRPLEKLHIDLITVVMAVTLSDEVANGTQMCVLDVNRGKLFNLSVPITTTKAVVDAELAYVAALWHSV